MKIYIYGGKAFKKHMNSILLKANLSDIVLEIDDVIVLEERIQEDNLSIYLIDSDKIVNKNIITEKLKFLKPKDSIYKCVLLKAGIEDVCFNNDEALLEYIQEKTLIQTNKIEENNIAKKERDMSEITQIDEIFEDDLLSALDTEITIKNEKNDPILEKIESNELSTINTETSHKDSNELVINSSNIDDVTNLIKELLNNKTLELSIKIKAS